MLLARGVSRRSGLSLLEVLIALAIFLLSITALWHLVSMATVNAERAHHMAQASRIAQSKLHLAMAGKYSPLSDQEEMPADDDDPGLEDDGELHGYTWSLQYLTENDDSEHPFAMNLGKVVITVSHPLSSGETIQVVLSQMVIDPNNLGTTQDALLPLSSTNTPSLGYTIPGGPLGTNSGTTGTTTNTGGN
jgi:general secretion pathway protein I